MKPGSGTATSSATAGSVPMILASLLLAFSVPGPLNSGVPAFSQVAAHVSDHVIALSFTVNTGVIVAIQMLVLRLVRRHRRSSALAVIGVHLCGVLGASRIRRQSSTVQVADRNFICLRRPVRHGGDRRGSYEEPAYQQPGRRQDTRTRKLDLRILQLIDVIVCPAIVTGLLAAHLAAVWIALLCLSSLGIVAIAARLRVTLTAEQDLVKQPPAAESPLEELGESLEQEGESLYPPVESP